MWGDIGIRRGDICDGQASRYLPLAPGIKRVSLGYGLQGFITCLVTGRRLKEISVFSCGSEGGLEAQNQQPNLHRLCCLRVEERESRVRWSSSRMLLEDRFSSSMPVTSGSNARGA